MSGGWSRYTRGASSGQGTGCWSAIVAALAMLLVLLTIRTIVLPDESPRVERNAQL